MTGVWNKFWMVRTGAISTRVLTWTCLLATLMYCVSCISEGAKKGHCISQGHDHTITCLFFHISYFFLGPKQFRKSWFKSPPFNEEFGLCSICTLAHIKPPPLESFCPDSRPHSLVSGKRGEVEPSGGTSVTCSPLTELFRSDCLLQINPSPGNTVCPCYTLNFLLRRSHVSEMPES